MIAAGVDLGTNTCLLVIAEFASDGSFEVLEDRQHLPRLGQGVDSSGMISEDAINRTEQVLYEYKALLESFSVRNVHFVATSAMRSASNREEVALRLSDSLGFPLAVIDAKEEAKLTFDGAIDDRSKRSLLLDIGGGSTEYAWNSDSSELESESFDIGSVRLSERWLKQYPPDITNRTGLFHDVVSSLSNLPSLLESIEFDQCVAVAGTATALAMIDLGLTSFDPKRIEGYRLSLDSVIKITEQLLSASHVTLSSLSGISKNRADILPAGAAILLKSMEMLGFSEVVVSTRGLRYGALKLASASR